MSASTWVLGLGLALGAPQVFFEAFPLGVAEPVRRERNADEDADDEREENRSKGRDVVAEIEHERARSSLELSASLAQGMQPGQRFPGKARLKP